MVTIDTVVIQCCFYGSYCMTLEDLEIFNKNLLVCLHKVTSSLRLFSVPRWGLQIIKILIPQTQIAPFGTRVVRNSLLQNLPSDLEVYVTVFQISYVLAQLSAHSFIRIVKGCFVVRETSLKRVFS